MIEVPEHFNKNSSDVRALGSPTETGRRLIDYMCDRMRLPNLEGKSVLDFGCGGRFTESIINLNLPIGSYTGIDVDPELVKFLQSIDDDRFQFAHWDAKNPYYNPDGKQLSEEDSLPIQPSKFDIICMFSVISHQLPDDTKAIFSILRRYIKDSGFLFFSSAIYDLRGDYRELMPGRIALLSGYSLEHMIGLLYSTKWGVISFEPELIHSDPVIPIQDSFLCAPR